MVFDAGFSGNGGATTRGSGTAMPGLSTPPASASPTTLPSASIGSGVPGTPQPIESASPATSAGPSQHPTGFAQQGDGIVYLAADGTVTYFNQAALKLKREPIRGIIDAFEKAVGPLA